MIKDQIDWHLTRLAALSSTYKSLPTSLQYQSEVIYKLRCMFLLLPTLDYLRKTQPHLYSDTTYILCKQTDEDWFHVFICPQQRQNLNDCIERTVNNLAISLYDHIPDQASFKSDLLKLHIWSIPVQRNDNPRGFNIVDLLQGFIYYRLKSFLT